MRIYSLSVVWPLAGLAIAACGGARPDAPPDGTTFPLPHLVALEPDSALAEASSASLSVTGSGFTSRSTVSVAGQGVPTTYRSDGQLDAVIGAAQLRNGAALSVHVENPSPGGGVSASLSFRVVNASPTITALSPSSMPAGSTARVIHVTGTGFTTKSSVLVGGAPRATSFASASDVSAQLTADDVKDAGAAQVRVQNPSPGGGVSAVALLPITGASPLLTRLPSSGATAGRGGATLAVDGMRFTPLSVVTWNGADRVTTYVSGTRLVASITAGDLASIGVAQLAVRTPGAPPSASLPVTVRTVAPPAVTDRVVVHLPARDIVYDPRTDRLYASVAASGGANANSVVAIDPHTGQVTGSVFVGDDPRQLARSDDGQYLYVSLANDTAVRRVQITPLSAQLEFGMGANKHVGDLQVRPGFSRTVAVVRTSVGYPTNLTIFDDDQPRPNGLSGVNLDLNVLAFVDSSTLLSFASLTSTLTTYSVDTRGLTAVRSSAPLSRSARSFVYAAGRVYSTRGDIGDPESGTTSASWHSSRGAGRSASPPSSAGSSSCWMACSRRSISTPSSRSGRSSSATPMSAATRSWCMARYGGESTGSRTRTVPPCTCSGRRWLLHNSR